jgi:hypothetical protein
MVNPSAIARSQGGLEHEDKGLLQVIVDRATLFNGMYYRGKIVVGKNHF